MLFFSGKFLDRLCAIYSVDWTCFDKHFSCGVLSLVVACSFQSWCARSARGVLAPVVASLLWSWRAHSSCYILTLCTLFIVIIQDLLAELERTLALLAFDDPANSPFGDLLLPSHRLKVNVS